jgi:hypothetical protein
MQTAHPDREFTQLGPVTTRFFERLLHNLLTIIRK